MRRFLENPTATAASTTTLVLASSRPVHSAQNDDGLLKLGLFRCSGRGVGAANQAPTVDAILPFSPRAPYANLLVKISVMPGRSSLKNQPSQTGLATKPDPFAKAIRNNLEHNEVQSQRILP